jgi:hypothetical protein
LMRAVLINPHLRGISGWFISAIILKVYTLFGVVAIAQLKVLTPIKNWFQSVFLNWLASYANPRNHGLKPTNKPYPKMYYDSFGFDWIRLSKFLILVAYDPPICLV